MVEASLTTSFLLTHPPQSPTWYQDTAVLPEQLELSFPATMSRSRNRNTSLGCFSGFVAVFAFAGHTQTPGFSAQLYCFVRTKRWFCRFFVKYLIIICSSFLIVTFT